MQLLQLLTYIIGILIDNCTLHIMPTLVEQSALTILKGWLIYVHRREKFNLNRSSSL